jgi:hypothetical protein
MREDGFGEFRSLGEATGSLRGLFPGWTVTFRSDLAAATPDSLIGFAAWFDEAEAVDWPDLEVFVRADPCWPSEGSLAIVFSVHLRLDHEAPEHLLHQFKMAHVAYRAARQKLRANEIVRVVSRRERSA